MNQNTQPAIDLINQQLQEKLAYDDADTPLHIGIDGNEANVSNRVGSNVYTFQLLTALSQLDSAHRFTIYLKHPPLQDMPPATDTWQYKVIPFPRLWSQIKLPWTIFFSSDKPDIFFAPGHYVSPLLPMPVAISILDLAYLTHPDYFNPSDLRQLTNWTKRSVNKASHIFTISQNSYHDIIKQYQVPSNLITVTYPGINHQQFQFPQLDTDINQVKQTYQLPDDYLLYVGTLQPRKNLVTLIEAFHQINHPTYKLVIAGKKGWMYEQIFEKVRQLNLKDKIIFTDFVPDEHLAPLMAGARALLLISLYEGFGIPVVEAQAVGTPGIVSNISSLPEIIDQAGYVVDPQNVDDVAQKIQQIIDLPHDKYVQLQDRALEHAAAFTWSHAAAVTLRQLELMA